MKMTKTEALKQIEELRKYIEEKDKKKDEITQWPNMSNGDLKINEEVALNVFSDAEHVVVNFFSDEDGEWTDENGDAYDGELTYKSKA